MMAVNTARIEDLKRRVQRDPASIAFAQLGEEYRRAGRHREAIETCRAGLDHHPGYLSARVTLGRALIETGELDQAERELKEVLRVAAENLAALRGLADIAYRRQDRDEALGYYRRSLSLAPHDSELQQRIDDLQRQAPPTPSLSPEEPVAPPPPPLAKPPSVEPVAATPPVAPPAPDPDPHTTAVLSELERWHAAILADRQNR